MIGLLTITNDEGESDKKRKAKKRFSYTSSDTQRSSSNRRIRRGRMKIPVEKSIYRKVYLQLRTGFLTERVGDNWVCWQVACLLWCYSDDSPSCIHSIKWKTTKSCRFRGSLNEVRFAEQQYYRVDNSRESIPITLKTLKVIIPNQLAMWHTTLQRNKQRSCIRESARRRPLKGWKRSS